MGHALNNELFELEKIHCDHEIGEKLMVYFTFCGKPIKAIGPLAFKHKTKSSPS